MGTEIERKFLVKDDSWRAAAESGVPMRQGYLCGNDNASVRVRIEGDAANLNIKSATLGIRRLEFEYEISVDEADQMLDTLCGGRTVDKTRYVVHVGRHEWEIDVFESDNAGLIVAEVELASEDDSFELPSWAGDEVSDDVRYYNVQLLETPYKDW